MTTTKKTVSFNKLISIYYYNGVDLKENIDWIKLAINRSHFQNRINKLDLILKPVLIDKLTRINRQE